MKTMKNFAAQQLTKKQMNEVKGGDYLCACDHNAGTMVMKGGIEMNWLHQAWADVNCGGAATCYRLS